MPFKMIQMSMQDLQLFQDFKIIDTLIFSVIVQNIYKYIYKIHNSRTISKGFESVLLSDF